MKKDVSSIRKRALSSDGKLDIDKVNSKNRETNIRVVMLSMVLKV